MFSGNSRHCVRNKNRVQEGESGLDDKSKRLTLCIDSCQCRSCVYRKVAKLVQVHKGGIEDNQQVEEMSRHGKPADDSAKLSVVIPKIMKVRIKDISSTSGLQSFSDTARVCLEYGLQRMERDANGKRH